MSLNTFKSLFTESDVKVVKTQVTIIHAKKIYGGSGNLKKEVSYQCGMNSYELV